MIRSVAMCKWTYNERTKQTNKVINGYLPGRFTDDGFLREILPYAFAQSAATPEEAMKLVDKPAGTIPGIDWFSLSADMI
jgi:hypothetical protein